MFSLTLERGEGRERKRETTHTDQHRAYHLRMHPDWQPFRAPADAQLNEPHQPRHETILNAQQ